MKAHELQDAIGKTVTINNSGDLYFDSYTRNIIGKECKLIKQCKSGLLQVEYKGKSYVLPMRNVDYNPAGVVSELKPGEVLDLIDEKGNFIGWHIEPTQQQRDIMSKWIAKNTLPHVGLYPMPDWSVKNAPSPVNLDDYVLTKAYSFRAECPHDVNTFLLVCLTRGILVKTTSFPDKGGLPDVDVDMTSSASLEVLLDVMRKVDDGNVMYATLRACPLAQNPLTRDSNIE